MGGTKVLLNCNGIDLMYNVVVGRATTVVLAADSK